MEKSPEATITKKYPFSQPGVFEFGSGPDSWRESEGRDTSSSSGERHIHVDPTATTIQYGGAVVLG